MNLGHFTDNHPFISVNRRILSTADAIIVSSPNLLEPCRKAVSSNQRVALIPFGVNTQVFEPQKPSIRVSWRKKLQIPEHSIVLVSPRGWAPYYRQPDILEAFGRAYSKFTFQTYLVFCKLPRSHDMQKQISVIKKRAEQLGIAESIRWLPHLKHDMMPYCYALSDIVINYPSTDAFPSTLLEAAACGRHIVSSRLPAYKKTFIEDVCTLVEPNNPAALAEAMVEAANAPAKKLVPKLLWARQEIVEKYEETIMKDRLWHLYRDLVSPPT
jgi:glycosyltransferase involved in cell wall biosynthesis